MGIYDSLIEQQEQTTGITPPKPTGAINIYDNILTTEQDNVRKYRSAIMEAVKTSPDRAAHVQKIAKELMLPTEVVDRNVDDLDKLARARRLELMRSAQDDPVLARQLSDHDFAKIAQDDTDNLSFTGKVFKFFRDTVTDAEKGFKSGRLTNELGFLGERAKSGEDNKAMWAKIAELQLKQKQLKGTGGFIESAAQIVGQQFDTMSDVAMYGLQAATAAGGATAIAGQLGPQAVLPEEIITVPAAMVAGFTAGSIAKMSEQSYRIEAGANYLDMLESGVDKDVARYVSTGVGMVNAALEVAGMKFVAAPFKKLLIKETTEQISKSLTKPTMQAALKQFGKDYAGAVLGETSTEVLQEISNVIGEEIGRSMSDMQNLVETEEGRKQIGERLTGIFEQVTKGMAVLAIPGAGLHFRKEIGRVKDAEKNAAFFDSLAQGADTSKVLERNPDAYHSFISNHAADAQVENIYIDGKVFAQTLNQHGIKAEELDQVVPGLSEKVQAAALTGGDVVMSTADYATHLAKADLGKAMLPHVRTDASALSVAEATQAGSLAQQLFNNADQVMQKNEERKEWVRSANEVQKTMFDQIKGTGAYSDPVSRLYAATVKAFYVNLADRNGTTPMEEYQKNPYKVEMGEIGQGQSGITYNQEGNINIDENFKRWFKESKAVDAEGRPLVVYHGTGDVFHIFSINELGANTSAQSAKKGFFFSNSPRNANRYTVWSPEAINEALGLRPPKGTSNISEWIENNNIWKKSQDEVDAVIAKFKELVKKNNYANKEASAWFEVNTPKLLESDVNIPDSMVISYDELAKSAGVDTDKMSSDDLKKGLANYASNYTPDAGALALKKQYDEAVGLLEYAQDLEYNRRYSKQFEESYDLDFDEVINARKPEPQANIMPVYLSMQNPFVYDYNGNYRDVSFSELLDKAKAGGYDSAIFKNVNDPLMGDVYVVFEPTQIKSVNNRGTFDPNNPNILYQNGKDVRDLIITHNLTGKNLLHAVKMGGIPVPSLAVTKKGQALDSFGDITLIGSRDMADPKGYASTKVFGADIYSPRYPDISFKLDNKALSKLNDMLAPYRKDGDRLIYSSDINKIDDLTQNKAFRSYAMEKLGKTDVWDMSFGDMQSLATELMEKAGAEERIFRGYTNNGRRYVAHTLENVVKILKKELRGGENFNYGVGSLRAKFTPQFRSIEQIRKAKDRLLTKEEFEKVKDEVNDEFFKIVAQLDPEGKKGFGFSDTVMGVMEDAPKMGITRALESYGLKDVSSDIKQDMVEYLEKLRHLPTEYFEAKILRDVDLSEFRGAVIPKDTAPEVREALEKRGLKIAEYEPGKVEDRRAAVEQFADELDQQNQNILFQNKNTTRGGYDPSRLTTILTQDTDYSTFLHETGHFFLDTYSKIASDPNAPAAIKEDMQTILNWFGIESLEAWNAMDLEQQRQYHEQFAYNFEIWVAEGKSPSIKMESVFRTFGRFLKQVYENIRDELNDVYRQEHGKDLPILTGEVRQVMERMLASEKQIKEAEAVRGMAPIFEVQPESMSDEEWAAYREMQQQAHDNALDEHTRASLRQMKWLEGAKSKVLKSLQAQAKEARAKVKAEVTQEVMMEPIYRAIQFLKTGEAVSSEGKSVKEEGPHKLSIAALKQMYPEKPAKEKKVKPPKLRSFLGDISKAGGITYDSLVQALDVNEIRGNKGGNRFMAITGRKGRGWGMDQMAGMMQDQGWDVPMDVDGNLDTDAFAQIVKEAVNGNRPVHPDDVSTVVEQEDAARALAEDDDYLKSLVEFYDQQQIDPGYPEWQALGYGKSGMLAEDGLHPDLIAGLFGFHSGDALVRTLLDTAPIKKTINSVTDQRMLEEHGELTDPKALAIAVDRAIHNEARARFIAVELRHLSKSVRPVRVMQEAARQAARAIIGKKPIGTINPKDYSGAEAKAAVAAETAMKKGDTAAATQAKEHQLLQNMLASESLKANTFVAEQLDGFKKVFSPDKRLSKTRDMNYVNVARSILAHYGIGSATETADSYLSKIRQYDPEFYAEIEPMITAHQEASKFATDLTFDQFQDLADQVQMLWHLSRRVKQIEIDGQLMDRKEVVGMLDSRIRSLIKPGERAGYTKAMTKWDEAKIKLMGVRASLRRVESWVDAMDGGNPAGPFRTFIWNPISEAVTKFRGAQGKYFGRYVEILKEAEITLQGQDIVSEELDYTFKPQELLHAILHTGNSSNKRKLLLGRGWAEFSEDGETMDTSRWDTFINRAVAEGRITKDYYDFAQKVWDLMEEMKPGAQKAHHDMYGYYFNEITAEALETPWGVYAGGYVPAVTDARIVTEGALRNEQETQMADNSFMFPTTGRGFTKGRVKYNRPLLLDLGYLASHIDKVLRFTYIEPRVKDVARIVKTNKAFGETMDELDPTVRNDMLVPWLQRTAMQMVSIPSKGWGGKAADSFFTYLRTNTGLQMMVANVTNTLQQFTGLSISALKVKPALLRNALWQYTRQPGDTAQMVADKSDYMKTRMTAQQYEMRQKMDSLLLNPTKYDKVVEFAKEHGYFMQQATQNIVDTITWVGAYNQAVQTGVSEKDAVRQADSAVRQTQGSFAPEDISRFETGSAFVRAFTHFYSYFNMQANILGTEFVKVARELGVKDGAGKMLYIYTFGFMIPAVLSEMIVQAAGGFDAGDDDEYDLWNAMGLFFGSQFRTLSAMVPGVGPAVVAGVNAWNRKPYDDRMSTSPAVSTIEATVSAPHSVYKAIAEDGSWKKATRDTLTALGLITRLPLGQLGKPAGYLMDVQQGKAEPEGVTDVVRGLISGKDVNRNQ